VKKSKNGKPDFVLTARNEQAIGTSGTYQSAAAMKNAIDSVNAPDADVEDLTSGGSAGPPRQWLGRHLPR